MTTPTPMTGEEIAAVAELERKATPGPWRFVRERNAFGHEHTFIRAPRRPVADCDYFHLPGADKNCEFIANARNVIPRLIATIAADRAEIERKDAALKEARRRLIFGMTQVGNDEDTCEAAVSFIDAALKDARHD